MFLYLLLVVGFLLYALFPRIDVEGTTALLESQGYQEINVTGWRKADLRCTKDDWFRTGFEARSTTGELVTGVVCSGRYHPVAYLD